MTTEQGSSGTNGKASGDPEKNPEDKKDTVSYDTHRRLLDEKKKMQAERDELAAKLRQREEAEAEAQRKKDEEQGNFKKLLETERAEKKRIEEEHNSLMANLQAARKKAAVLRHISGSVPDKIADALLKVDGVALNEDGSVDEDTAKIVAQEFEKDFHYVIQRDRKNAGLPNSASPGGGGGRKMTYEEWKALPTSAEMRKNYNNVDWSTA